MRISDQLQWLRHRLQQYVEPRGGKVYVAANQAHLWELLFNAGDAPCVFIACTGESNALPGEPDAARVMRDFEIIIVRGRGFKPSADAAQTGELDPLSGGIAEPFWDNCEDIRNLVRAMAGLGDESNWPRVVYREMRVLPSQMSGRGGSVFVDAVGIYISVPCDLPQIERQAPPGPLNPDGEQS
jgi:hypothetical protein